MAASVRRREFMFSPQSVRFNPPHPLPLYYHPPPLAPRLTLHHQPLQHSLTTQTRTWMLWIRAAHSRQQHATAYMTSLLFKENYSRRRCRQSDFTDFIAGLRLLATTQTACAQPHTHTYTSACQIDYRFSVSNPFTVPKAAAATTRSRRVVCVCVSVSV